MKNSKIKLYPMLMDYIPKSAIWGGTTLKKLFGKTSSSEKIAETWELSVRDGAQSVIKNGPYRGIELATFLDAYGESTISTKKSYHRFPLLVKFIDASADLSIQVHPDDDYALFQSGSLDSGKTELWHIVHAEPRAKIVYGANCSAKELRDLLKKCQNKEIEKYLNFVEVCTGETYYLPAGQIHAIGRGIVIAEVQQNSDLTYRLYDYDRISDDGTKRPLHLEEAAVALKDFEADKIYSLRFSRGEFTGYIANSDFFAIKIYDQRSCQTSNNKTEGIKQHKYSCKKEMNALLCVGGEGRIIYQDEDYPIKAGDCYFLPCGIEEYELCGEAKILIITP